MTGKIKATIFFIGSAVALLIYYVEKKQNFDFVWFSPKEEKVISSEIKEETIAQFIPSNHSYNEPTTNSTESLVQLDQVSDLKITPVILVKYGKLITELTLLESAIKHHESIDGIMKNLSSMATNEKLITRIGVIKEYAKSYNEEMVNDRMLFPKNEYWYGKILQYFIKIEIPISEEEKLKKKLINDKFLSEIQKLKGHFLNNIVIKEVLNEL